jgi:pilus assembly protein CpaF
MSSGNVKLSPSQIAKLKARLLSAVTNEIGPNPPSAEDYKKAIQDSLDRSYQRLNLQLPEQVRQRVFNNIMNDLVGYGPIQPFLDDISISEVMVNGHGIVFIER